MKIIATARPASSAMRLAPLLRGLELGGEVEQGRHLGGREVVDREEAAAGEVELGQVALSESRHAIPLAATVDWCSMPPKRRRGRSPRPARRSAAAAVSKHVGGRDALR